MKKVIFRNALVIGVIMLFIGANIIPIALTKINTTTTDSCDIPTWYVGDEWIYTADPVSFQSDNGSFSGKIENLKRKVVGITTITHGDEQFDVYEINSTGDISGVITWGIVTGDLEGLVEGVSYIRVSDLAEVETEIVSIGIIQTVIFDLDYELTNTNSFYPPLELYDFPLKLYEQWSISCNVITSGYFEIEDLVYEDISGNDMIDEIVQCNNKETVSVPAGNFESYKVSYSTDSYWYSPEVGNLVKSEVGEIGRDNTINMDLTLDAFSRAIQPIDVTENIDPSEAFIDQEINISGTAVDSNSDPIQNGNIYIEIPRIGESWSTNTDENGFYNITIEAPFIEDDTQSEGEFGSDGIIVRCTSGNLEGYKVKSLLIIDNFPPNPPTIDGETNGKVGKQYEYTFVSSDEDGDDIIFLVNWGDGSPIETVIPSVPSGVEAKANHVWDNKGVYNITAKTKDVWGAYSKWSDPFSVTMPRTRRLISDQILGKLLERFSYIFPILRYLFEP